MREHGWTPGKRKPGVLSFSCQYRLSDAVGRTRHDFRHRLHQFFDRQWQFGAAVVQRGGRVPGFVDFHLLQNGMAATVVWRQLVDMFIEMFHYLVLGFSQKTKVPPVTQRAGESADREGARIPYRIQQAGAGAELAQPVFCPDQMVILFERGLFKFFPYLLIARGDRLALVQGLGRDFAGVIHAHQRDDVFSVVLVHFNITEFFSRIWPMRRRWPARDCTQRGVGVNQKPVDWAVMSHECILHTVLNTYNTRPG